VGPKAGLNGCGKISPPSGFDPRTFQLVASRYTDYATRFTNTTCSSGNYWLLALQKHVKMEKKRLKSRRNIQLKRNSI
jgi:hypothetical protein